MSSLSSLLECCKAPCAPEYFLMRLQEYAEAENRTLKQAAIDILPFCQLFNCVLFTTILGCILARPELITAAASSYIYREPLLRVIKTFPALNLQRHLPISVQKPQQRLTKLMVAWAIDPEAYQHLLLAHCGLVDVNKDDEWLCELLRLNSRDKAYMLEQYVAQYGLPPTFAHESSKKPWQELSIENLNHYLALICAANQYNQYLEPELDNLLKHLVKQGNKGAVAMQLLASNPSAAALLAMRHRHNPEMTPFLTQHKLQMGWAMQIINNRDFNVTTPFSTPAELQNVHYWIIASALLGTPIKPTKIVKEHLNAVLESALTHPRLRLRFDDKASLLLKLATQTPLPSALKLTVESMQTLADDINHDIAALRKALIIGFLRNIPNALFQRKKMLSAFTLGIIIICEAIQVNVQSYVPIWNIENASCDDIQVVSPYFACISCQFLPNSIKPSQTMSVDFQANNFLISWVRLIDQDSHWRFTYPSCFLTGYRIQNVIHPAINPWFPYQRVCLPLPTCSELAKNTLPIVDYFIKFYDHHRLDTLPYLEEASWNGQTISQSVNGVIISFYILSAIAILSFALYYSSAFSIRYQLLLDSLLERLSLFNKLMHKANLRDDNAVAITEKLESMAVVQPKNPEDITSLLKNTLFTNVLRSKHRLTDALNLSSAIVTTDIINQAPDSSYLISKALFNAHHQQPDAAIPDDNVRMYHLV